MGAVAVSGLLASTLAGTAAQADTNTATGTALAAVGSDTIDELVNQLSTLAALNTDLANYTATPAGNIVTTANFPAAARAAGANCTFTRPNGSGAGKNTLSASMRGAANGGSANVKECVGIARSSNNTFPTGTNAVPTGTMARIPLALDAVAPAVRNGSTIGKRFTLDFLKSVYTRNGAAGSAACLGVVPLIPQAGSGTRGFWATAMGVTDYDFSGTSGTVGTPPAGQQTWGSCVTGGPANPLGFGTAAGNGNPGDRSGGAAGAPIQEHNGTFISANNMVGPYSIGQYIVQGSGIATDLRGSAVLASVDFTTVGDPNNNATFTVNNAAVKHPFTINDANNSGVFNGARGDLTRQVFLFVPRALYDSAFTPPAAADAFAGTSAADKARFAQAFASGTTSDMCNTSTIVLFGFSPQPDCGTPTLNP
jgi:hypothetical protein